MISTQYIRLNMIPSGVMPILYCSQYDIGRPLGLVVYNGSESVDLSGYTATIEATRSDGTPVTVGVTTSTNIGVFATTATMTNNADQYKAKLVLVDSNSKRVASIPFILCVNANTMDENAEEIEENASLYQQYTQTVQTIIASIRANLAAEVTNRQAAVTAEATARQTADNTLQSNINAEASARSSQDALLQAEIDQIIAPSGDAPSAAEVENARIGSDGTVYSTLGDAIRTQNSLLKSQLNTVDGVFDLSWEQGGLWYDTGIEFNSDTSCRTAFVLVAPGSVVYAYNKLAGVHNVYVYEFADNTTTASGVNERLYATELSNGQPLKLSANTNYVRLRVNDVALTDAKSKIALVAPGFILDRIYRNRDYTEALSVLAFFDTSNLSSFGVSDMPRNTYTVVTPASKFTDLPADVSSAEICVYRTNYNEAGNLSVVILYTRENNRLEDIYYGFYRESIPFSGFTKLSLNDEVDALEQFDADYITPHIKRKNYNILDLSNLETINSYIDIATKTLTHSVGAVKTMIVPSVPGKTYTFTRKNACSRLSMGFGEARWTDDQNHTLINVTDYTFPKMSTQRLTLQAPENGNWLYIYYYRGASDSDYDATTEDAMITETAYPVSYLPYGYDINLDSTNRWETRKKIYGIEFDTTSSDPSCTRIADAVGVADYDEIFPWCEMRRCAVTVSNGQKRIVYEGDSGYAVDGTAGNVMVEIPAFYVKRERYGTKERWLISGTQYGGFEIHPWFVDPDGTEVAYRYYGAYKACDEVGNIFSASGKSVYTGLNHPLTTLVTKMRAAGYNRNTVNAFSAIQYLFTIEFATRNSQDIYNGSTYNPYFSTESTAAFELVSSITDGNTLVLPNGYMYSGNSFRFYSAGMQVFIGTAIDSGEIRTVTAIAFDSNNTYITVDGAPITLVEGLRCAGIYQTPGQTDSLTEVSGYAIGQDSHVASFRYRGIENPWGCLWEVLDGLRLKNGKYYYEPDPQAETANMTPLTYTAPMISASDHDSNNWIKTLGFDVNHRTVALPETPLLTDSGESITLKTDDGVSVASGIVLRGQKYFCDAFYSTTNTSIELIPAVGGGWDHHENAGLFCMRFISENTQVWLYGERATC